MKKTFLILVFYNFTIRKVIIFLNALAVFSLLITNISVSQSLPWQRVYKGPSWSDCYGTDICSADNENYYVISTNTYPRGIYILKINTLGDTLWTRFILDGEASSVASTLDGGCIVTGFWHVSSSPIITYTLKINSAGSILWQKLYDSTFATESFKIIRTPDNKYLTCGKTDIGFLVYGFLNKLDSNGNEIWEKYYESLDTKYYKDICIALDGSYFVCGFTTDTPSEFSKGLLTKFDTSGNILWEKRYNLSKHSLGNIVSINNLGQNYLISGDAFDSTTMKYGLCFKIINQYGNILNSHFYQRLNNSRYYSVDSKVLNNNRFLINYYRIPITNDTLIANSMITDSVGNILVQKEYNEVDYTYAFTSRVFNNNIFFIGCSNHINYYRKNIWLVKTDSSLYAPPVGINNITTKIPDNYNLFQNYPNPFNLMTIVKWQMLNAGYAKIVVINILGKEVATLVNEKLKPGTYEIRFDGSNFSSGIYFYSLYVGNKLIETKKLTLIK